MAKTTDGGPVRKLEKAHVISAEDGQKTVNTLMELPIKFGPMIGPILALFQKGIRADVTIKESNGK